MKSTATKAATGKKGKATIAAQATANPVLATEKIAQTDNEKKHGKKILSDNLFPVVGIGASAGGLDAFKRLLKAIPEKSGMAYIIVQHLDPNHKSILTELLQKITPIPVEEITDNVEVRPDHIYIIPSNKLLTATDGVLQLSDRLPRNYKTMSIDLFFCSLAEVHQSHAIGVVLSGTGKDGTAGLRAIKDQGGITFAQELQSSSHDAMPQSAIDADVVDFILPPEGIPEKLLSVSKAFKPVSGLPEDAAEVALEIGFKQILFLLRIRKGVDFSYYKQTTIRRRITRRIALSLKGSMPEYLAFLKTNGEEQDMLFQDLLIPVTQFFRDPKVFAQLCDTVFPSLLKNREGSDPLRFWIAGCSTGQEVYSMVMCMHEYLDDKAMISRIQIFGTDISEPAITKARNGIYTKTEVEGVSAVRLKKFFTRTDGRYRINKNIRESCMFANHNYLKDPPFAQIDLISCRNSLIYLEQVVQKNALTTFHYALKEGGFLLLGKSETTAQVPDLYMVFDKGSKIYTRKPGRGKFSHALTDRPEEAFINTGNVLSKGEGNKDDFQKAADDIILSKALAGVVVNKDLDIVQFRGATGLWLEPSPGKPNMNVIKMAREGLAFELRSALHKVKESQEAFIKEEIPIQFLGRENLVTIEVSPLTGLAETYFLILFRDTTLPVSTVEEGGKTKPMPVVLQKRLENRIDKLQKELALAREDMRSITEDQEASNEELQSVNEELLSGSEELQSLNEELETSKEETQTSNEELIIVNQELADRNEQLNLLRLYSESIVSTISEPLIILNKEFFVRSANRAYYNKFETTEKETTGNLFFELGNGKWDLAGLRKNLEAIFIQKNDTIEFEATVNIRSVGERIFQINAGVVKDGSDDHSILLAMIDVTAKHKAAREQELFAENLEKQVRERTASLHEANIELLHSNRNLEQFAYIASHDLQEPLRKIMTFTSMLEANGDVPESCKTLINKISVSAIRMTSLIKDVLNITRILNSDTAFESTDLNSILSNIIYDFELLVTEKGAVITNETLPVIDAIPMQMNQLFYNLISNALKFSRKDVPPVIAITCRYLLQEEVFQHKSLIAQSSYCEISFEDNGIGFKQEYADKIFLIFQQLNARNKYPGTGIGLSLCKSIVLNHGGEIEALSNAKDGALFRILLPLKQ